VAFPQTTFAPEGSKSAFRGDARSAENNNIFYGL